MHRLDFVVVVTSGFVTLVVSLGPGLHGWGRRRHEVAGAVAGDTANGVIEPTPLIAVASLSDRRGRRVFLPGDEEMGQRRRNRPALVGRTLAQHIGHGRAPVDHRGIGEITPQVIGRHPAADLVQTGGLFWGQRLGRQPGVAVGTTELSEKHLPSGDIVEPMVAGEGRTVFRGWPHGLGGGETGTAPQQTQQEDGPDHRAARTTTRESGLSADRVSAGESNPNCDVRLGTCWHASALGSERCPRRPA